MPDDSSLQLMEVAYRRTPIDGYSAGRDGLEQLDNRLPATASDADGWNARCIVLWLLGRHEEALQACDRGLALAPDDVALRTNRGIVLSGLQRYDDARVAVESALSIKPDASVTWNALGILLVALGEKQEALEALHRARALEQARMRLLEGAAILFNCGQLAFALGRYEEAVEAYSCCIRVQRSEPADAAIDAWPGLAEALLRLGRRRAARRVLREATANNEHLEGAWARIGDLSANIGNSAYAIRAYDAALELDPRSVALLCSKGKALMARKRWREALACFAQACAADPASGRAWFNRGFCAFELARWGESLDAYRRAVELEFDVAVAWSNIGAIYSRRRQDQEALDAEERALQIDPDCEPAWLGRGLDLSRLGHNVEALASYNRALELNPHRALTWQAKVRTLRNMHAWRELWATVREGIRRYPTAGG